MKTSILAFLFGALVVLSSGNQPEENIKPQVKKFYDPQIDYKFALVQTVGQPEFILKAGVPFDMMGKPLLSLKKLNELQKKCLQPQTSMQGYQLALKSVERY